MTLLPHIHHGKPAFSTDNPDRSTHSGLRPGDKVKVQGDGYTFDAKVSRLWANDPHQCTIVFRRGRVMTQMAVDTRTCTRLSK